MKKKEIPLHNRDISWLSFNYRVLLEARRHEVPLYEKIKFLAIFSSNLDEFFRVRFANLKSLYKLKKKKKSVDFDGLNKQLLEDILDIVNKQQAEFGEIYSQIIIPELKKKKIHIWADEKLSDLNQSSLNHYFKSKVLAFIQPKEIDPNEKNGIFLKNRVLYFAIRLESKTEAAQERTVIVNIPSDNLPRFVELATGDDSYLFIFLDDMLRLSLPFLFPDDKIKGVWSIKLNRDAELYIDDEFSGDLVQKISKNLNQRNIGAPSRFLYDLAMPEDVLKILRKSLGLSKDELVAGGRYHNFYDFFEFPNPLKPKLEYEKWNALINQKLEKADSILDAIEKEDHLLHFPYESYDYVLRLFNEAANDPKVREIRTTIYRIASNSLIANALISASKNGKKVIVFMELKARFDEENNIKWAAKMEKAGVKIIYSMPGLKVHAKVALFIRDSENASGRIAFFGTGNFNEKTAGLYADHGLLTANEGMCTELEQLLKYLHKKKKNPKPAKLLISQFNMQPKFIELIDREMEHSRTNFSAHIIIKLNNLEDPIMIEKLYDASRAGVKIDLIVRGICRLVPNKKGYSENIRVIRIVDRYLEHARIFWFKNKGKAEVFMGSADWMKRNLYFRIEVIFPILNKDHKKEIEKNLEIQLNDNFKAVILDEHQNNVFQEKPERIKTAQKGFYTWIKGRNARNRKNLSDRPEKTS